MENRFFIIVTGWNCEATVRACAESIRKQTHENYYAVFFDDASEDGTSEAIKKTEFNYIVSEKNRGAAYLRDFAIKQTALYLNDSNDIVLFLGMDDELLPNALERINHEYEQGKLMTYGNWIDQEGNGLPPDFDLDFPEDVHRDRSYRQVKYRSTAPNTFRRFLYDVIKPEDLQFKGEWFKATTESEVMFSCLEQCGKDRIGVIREPIYLYNRVIGGSARRRFGIEYQAKIYSHVINKPKRALWSGSK